MSYEPQKFEKKWQEFWKKNNDLSEPQKNSKKTKKYILDMFPYPSGDGLHVGHVESYTATDIYSRYSRMNGFDVLHPQGWDAFGLPAENFAIKTGVHPAETTKKAITTFKEQMDKMGFSYDWSKELNSSDPNYYKWTQWIFLQFYKNGLAYKKKARVNWCPVCKTVLANEQVVSGKCERCETEVIQKDLEQWFFKITDFAEDLITGLDKPELDWPESTKHAQKNWIGKSEGAEIDFKVNDEKLKIFTTRPDTLFGCTYMVLAPEHPIISKLKAHISNPKEVESYIEKAKNKTALERTDLAKEKTGVRVEGFEAINPVNREKIPVWIADYVMMDYGTGAIMAVPAHDQRDWDFAKTHKLPIIAVIMESTTMYTGVDEIKKAGEMSELERQQKFEKKIITKGPHTGKGYLINSSKFNLLNSDEAKNKITEFVKGKKAIQYKLRDWLISRQRYWGAPIPIIYCDKCGMVPVPEKDLPVILPSDVDFKPTGESPLARSKDFQNVKCPKCGKRAKRESDTMDTFVCSSWYYLRYADPKNNKEFSSKKQIEKWLPVDIYLGGAEHTVLHLLYSRFFTKALQKMGYINFSEPFLKLRHQGIILAEDGRKMSKRWGNVINPDSIIKQYGADILRLYEMFLGPLEDTKPWDSNGIIGIKRFLDKVCKIKNKTKSDLIKNDRIERLLNKAIKKVTEDIENFKFNTAISELMIVSNEFEKQELLTTDYYSVFLILLSPFAPHLAEEIWHNLGNKESIFKQAWPSYDKNLIEEKNVTIVIQINGKVRDSVEVQKDTPQDQVERLTLDREKIKKYTAGEGIKKIIFVQNKLINIVI
jgi:leucyl-tRNA synthetase